MRDVALKLPLPLELRVSRLVLEIGAVAVEDLVILDVALDVLDDVDVLLELVVPVDVLLDVALLLCLDEVVLVLEADGVFVEKELAVLDLLEVELNVSINDGIDVLVDKELRVDVLEDVDDKVGSARISAPPTVASNRDTIKSRSTICL
jgi:hypothetical protein